MKSGIRTSFINSVATFFAVALIALISVTNVHAQNTKGSAVVATVTATVTVTKIDYKTREVKVKSTDGKAYKFVASTDVKNLDQVKKGDVITVVYTEALAYEVKSHSTNAGTTTAVASANTGEKPAAAVAQQTTVTVTITAIDTKAPSVTIKEPDGTVETIKVKDPSKLTGIKVGDVVDLTYTEAFAIKVDPSVKK